MRTCSATETTLLKVAQTRRQESASVRQERNSARKYAPARDLGDRDLALVGGVQVDVVTLEGQCSSSIPAHHNDLGARNRRTPTPAVIASLRFFAVAISSRVR